MKFGKVFRSTVEARMPQWGEFMVNYKALKQAVKRHGAPSGTPEAVATAFAEIIDPHVERVNNFYQDRIEEGVILLHALRQHVENGLGEGKSRPEFRTACQRSLVAIHFQLLLLQQYVALNFTAVAKILKKFEKKVGVPIRNDYMGAIVDLPFYRCNSLGELVEETERQFAALGRAGGSSSCDGGALGVASSSFAPPPSHQQQLPNALQAALPVGVGKVPMVPPCI